MSLSLMILYFSIRVNFIIIKHHNHCNNYNNNNKRNWNKLTMRERKTSNEKILLGVVQEELKCISSQFQEFYDIQNDDNVERGW